MLPAARRQAVFAEGKRLRNRKHNGRPPRPRSLFCQTKCLTTGGGHGSVCASMKTRLGYLGFIFRSPDARSGATR